ncbi:cell filamentation protein Fic [Pasteurellaceae bacterium USgator11]|nr:cell filamentation protein Fic [Pasteurellaceae bacterium UScroc12]TNG97284.1 cell filamentation protein Fic [Pasteurellaceae bacterium USgator41]TNH00958.1 cell filamentation protein Fic [Pasteurellaceae bacterium UScroc31]TNH02879.1 cell filamentation protein Fic [Pasteurellaceae bacterium USgator11]
MIMNKRIKDPIGGLWLLQYLNIELFQPLPVMSGIGGRRSTENDLTNGLRIELYQEQQRPLHTILAHLQFHLKNEIPHFEFLARFFQRIDHSLIQDWINREPTGQYARRSAFLYEFFTEQDLIPPENLGGNYIDAMNAELLVSASPEKVEKNSRWRVNNNLAGNRHFCPILIKTNAFIDAIELNIKEKLNQLDAELGGDYLLRSAIWLTLGESKSSFKIEGETDKSSRIQRFADVIARFTGVMPLPYDLSLLQAEILGKETIIKQLGIRQSPVFVGQTRHFEEIVHYIAPPHSTLSDKLSGMYQFWQKTEGQSPILRSAILAFAFIYIHPLADGNGRIHRFLFNDLLRRQKATYEPIILPISAVIAENSSERNAYARILEIISKPLMQSLAGKYTFSHHENAYPDGIFSNLVLENSANAEPIWRYPNLTPHVAYFADLVKSAIVYMREESHYLRSHDLAREAIKEIIEMPNHYIDRIIRTVQNNDGVLSHKLAKEYPFLTEGERWQEIVNAIKNAFKTQSTKKQ